MGTTEILAICSHPQILHTLVRLVNNNPEWNCTGAENEEQGINYFNERDFDLVLLGSGMDELSESRLQPAFAAINPNVKFIQHYGGGSGLLIAEIYGALGK